MSSAENDKDRSRGISRDMSPEAIARRIDIVSELRGLALLFGKAKEANRSALVETTFSAQQKEGNEHGH